MKIERILAICIEGSALALALCGMNGLRGYSPVTDAERLAYCGLVVCFVTIAMVGGVYGHIMGIERKIDELSEKIGGN